MMSSVSKCPASQRPCVLQRLGARESGRAQSSASAHVRRTGYSYEYCAALKNFVCGRVGTLKKKPRVRRPGNCLSNHGRMSPGGWVVPYLPIGS